MYLDEDPTYWPSDLRKDFYSLLALYEAEGLSATEAEVQAWITINMYMDDIAPGNRGMDCPCAGHGV